MLQANQKLFEEDKTLQIDPEGHNGVPNGTTSHKPIPETDSDEKENSWAPIQAVTNSRPTSRRSLSRSRSQNGYGCDDETVDEDLEGQAGENEKDPYEVGWEDGESDPKNPKSWSLMQKWIIVIMVSLSSLCV